MQTSPATPRQPRLAVAMIVKNEAVNLAACLESCMDLADEIIVVDSGSQDNTVQIACRFPKVRLIEHHDWQGFGRQRQVAQSHVRARWVLWIDADERITPELAESIRRVLDADHLADDPEASLENISTQTRAATVYSLNRLSWVFGRFIRHSGWHPDWVARLYPTTLTGYSDDVVHEHVLIPEHARNVRLQGNLLHYTYRDLQHYLVKSAQYASLWAQQRQTRGKRSSLTQGIVHGIGCFLKMYVIKAGFLDGKQGLLLALLSAHSTFVKYADLWIRHEAKVDKPGAQDAPGTK